MRAQLDGLGATGTRIIVTSDLDEYAIAALAAAPVDAYGVGTSLVTGCGAPTAGLVYKLVAREDARRRRWSAVAKKSTDKISIGGRKWALRRRAPDGVAQAEVVGIGHQPVDDGDDRRAAGAARRAAARSSAREPLEEARARHAASLAELPATGASSPAASRRSRRCSSRAPLRACLGRRP